MTIVPKESTDNNFSAWRRASLLSGGLARSATALLILLAALLRFYYLAGHSLWADEGNSAALARRSLAEIARRTAFDIHPPLYYWLLKGWTALFGQSEIALRSLSALLGVLLVYLTALLGARFFGRRVGLTAAFIAAISPLQVYYAQEARMYMLLAVVGTLTVLAALLIFAYYSRPAQRPGVVAPVYMAAVTAGLYTHYAYPLILLAVNLTALVWLWRGRRSRPASSLFGRVGYWLLLQLIPLLLYLPWLPTAWRQATTWPSERQAVALPATVERLAATLLFGLAWPYNLAWVAAAGLLLVLLATAWPDPKDRRPDRPARPGLALVLLWLWFLLPLLLTAVIFSPAFLKFLVAAAPPLALLLALAANRLILLPGRRRAVGVPAGVGLLLLVAGASILGLYHYYTNPAYARDNYRGIAAFIQAVGGPQDAVILNAEGQQDVFSYYYDQAPGPEAPLYPLPRQRPLNEMATVEELQEIADRAENVYAVYWAARQADPEGIIEGWLDEHLYKAADRWYGNVRLVIYATPGLAAGLPLAPVDYRFGPHIRLTGYALASRQVMPGDVLEVALAWKTDEPVEDYTVFVQVLDGASHLVGQRDAPPLVPASAWPAGETVADAQGVFIEPGTPPGSHRVIAGLYDSQTGRRLPASSAGVEDSPRDYVELGQVTVARPASPLPLEAFQIQEELNVSMGEVSLLGYDLYKPGYRSAPDTPLHAGDPVHLVAYWMARRPVPKLEDRLLIRVVTRAGQATPVSVIRPPAGTDYPIREWQPGEIVRAQYDLFLNDLEPGAYRLWLSLSPTGQPSPDRGAVTRPFEVR